MITLLICSLILNIALLGALAFAVWIIYTDDNKIRVRSDPCEPLEPIDVECVYGGAVDK